MQSGFYLYLTSKDGLENSIENIAGWFIAESETSMDELRQIFIREAKKIKNNLTEDSLENLSNEFLGRFGTIICTPSPTVSGETKFFGFTYTPAFVVNNETEYVFMKKRINTHI